jgi:hypothetical protein
MANPARIPDPRDPQPFNPTAPIGLDPLNPDPRPMPDPRLNPANDPRIADRTVVRSRSAGSGVMIAAVVLVLAIIAYFVFAPGTQTTVAPEQPTATESATPPATAPAPEATAPAAPADTTAPAPNAAAPAAPAEPAPAPAAPAAPAPAAPAQ